MKKLVFSLVLPFSLLIGNEISLDELKSFSAQKYRIDYDAQKTEDKEKIKDEYQSILKLVPKISNEVKNDVDLKVANNLATINIWSLKFLQNQDVNETVLKELYEKEKPKKVAKYKLSNILVNSKTKAQEIITNLEKIKDNKEKFSEFKKQAKKLSQDFMTNKDEGNIGWIEIQNLDKNIQEVIKNKKSKDLVLAQVENIGWQILFIEDFTPQTAATFEESKEFLTKIAKEQELIKKVNTLIEK